MFPLFASASRLTVLTPAWSVNMRNSSRWSYVLAMLPAIAILVAIFVVGSPAVAQDRTSARPDRDAVTAAAPADTEAIADEARETAAAHDGKLVFNFRYQPWQDVLDWFAEQAGLSLLLESPPPGTFNYRDSRAYTPSEALDVINSVLLTKGYTLVRSGRMLVLVNLEDGVPPNLVLDVPLDELDERGEFELIRVLFPVWNMTAEQERS